MPELHEIDFDAIIKRPLSPCPYTAAAPKGPALYFLDYYKWIANGRKTGGFKDSGGSLRN